jgi:Putative MetA-pathway of phenol degradation
MSIVVKSRGLVLLLCVCLGGNACHAQDLTPRAYVITPVHSNAVTLTYSFNSGSILFDPTLPITDSRGKLSIAILSYYHGFNLFGRSANITASLPYTVGNFEGNVNGTQQRIYRSGLMDSVFRFAVNIKGGPAMPLQEFLSWRQKTILGVSLKIVAPTGQYDATKLVTPGTNRWAFKPELGLSRRWGNWIFDAYGGVWFFTENSEFFSHNELSPGSNTLLQSPIGSIEMHLSYDFRRRLWASIDGNYWYGGRRSVNGVESVNSLQANSRIGGTVSVPISKHQSMKFSYGSGAVVRVGGNYQNVSVAWQYAWLGRPN